MFQSSKGSVNINVQEFEEKFWTKSGVLLQARHSTRKSTFHLCLCWSLRDSIFFLNLIQLYNVNCKTTSHFRQPVYENYHEHKP